MNDIEIESIYLHYTNKCNLYCKGCYSYDQNRNDESQDLSMEYFLEAVKQLKTYGLDKIIISGGEPTLRNDLDEFIKYLKEILDINYIVLITNGTNLPHNLLHTIREYVDDVAVSIDGYEEGITFIRPTGIHKIVMNNIALLKEAGINVSMIATLHRKNVNLMDKYQKLSEEMGIPLSYSILTCNNQNREECKDFMFSEDILSSIKWEDILSSIKWNENIDNTNIKNFSFETRLSCEAGRKMLSIAANGDVYPCHMLHVEEFKLGNIKDMTVGEILCSSKRLIWKNISVDMIDGCNICKFKYLCGGACRANAYYLNATLKKKDPYCPLYYNFYETIINLIREYNRKEREE